jgi:hypothetical protein
MGGTRLSRVADTDHIKLAIADSDEISEQTVPARRRDAVVERLVEDSLVLYDLHHQRAHVLNTTAAHIWRLCDGTRTVAQVTLDTRVAYPDTSDAVVEDVEQMIRLFAAERLLER